MVPENHKHLGDGVLTSMGDVGGYFVTRAATCSEVPDSIDARANQLAAGAERCLAIRPLDHVHRIHERTEERSAALQHSRKRLLGRRDFKRQRELAGLKLGRETHGAASMRLRTFSGPG